MLINIYGNGAPLKKHLFSPYDLCKPNIGFIDNCRICGKQIYRKAQSRPRICLQCEKKKATPIHDKCKDCKEPIIRSNVRKARICQKCKKSREKKKNELCQQNHNSYSPQRFPQHLNSKRIFAINNWLHLFSQTSMNPHFLLNNSSYSVQYHPSNYHNYQVGPSSRSTYTKIDTTNFDTSEDIVKYLKHRVLGKPDKISKSIHKNKSNILIPLVNPYQLEIIREYEMNNKNSQTKPLQQCHPIQNDFYFFKNFDNHQNQCPLYLDSYFTTGNYQNQYPNQPILNTFPNCFIEGKTDTIRSFRMSSDKDITFSVNSTLSPSENYKYSNNDTITEHSTGQNLILSLAENDKTEYDLNYDNFLSPSDHNFSNSDFLPTESTTVSFLHNNDPYDNNSDENLYNLNKYSSPILKIEEVK